MSSWYAAGYAAGGTPALTCREFRCKRPFTAGELRIGILYKANDSDDTKELGWYCFQPPTGGEPCLWKTFRYKKQPGEDANYHPGQVTPETPIVGKDQLRPEDAEKMDKLAAGEDMIVEHIQQVTLKRRQADGVDTVAVTGQAFNAKDTLRELGLRWQPDTKEWLAQGEAIPRLFARAGLAGRVLDVRMPVKRLVDPAGEDGFADVAAVAEKTFLVCPFAENQEAKQLGARFDGDKKKWYVQENTYLAPFAKWLPAGMPVTPLAAANGESPSKRPRVEGAPSPIAAPSPDLGGTRTYLSCPYAEKDEAKGYGARFDGDKKKWYVPEGLALDAFQKWLPK